MKTNIHLIILLLSCLVASANTVVAASPLPASEVVQEVEVYTLLPPDNGSGPLWSYGCTQVARLGNTVYVSEMETGEGVPRLCNTRWRLLRLEDNGFNLVVEDEKYRQREPCPIAVLPPSTLLLNVNDSIRPPGTEYGACKPLLRVFELTKDTFETRVIEPEWKRIHHFTDHSYRGYAVDPNNEQVIMLNIDATTGIEHACLMNMAGETLANADIEFPIRSCYPQVALRNGAVYMLAIGDIVEPVEEWRQYKYEQTQRKWDYVFRRLFFTWTPDIQKSEFAAPVEIENLDATCGHISNQDLWISPEGVAWILYTRREVQHALMRDKFFPDKSIQNSLWLAKVKAGEVIEKRVLLPESQERDISQAKFHVVENGALYIVLYVTGVESGNKLLKLYPEDTENTLVPIPLETPISSYCLANVRAGNVPSDFIDMFGTDGRENIYRYACVKLVNSTE